METTDVKIARMEGRLDHIDNTLTEIKETLRIHVENDNTRFHNLNKKFAPKWIEKVVWGVMFIILSGVGMAIMKVILK